jgi:hypothetical protein
MIGGVGRTFATATESRADALYVNADPLHSKNRQLIADFALKSRLPSMYEERLFVVAGGLLSYAPSSSSYSTRCDLRRQDPQGRSRAIFRSNSPRRSS